MKTHHALGFSVLFGVAVVPGAQAYVSVEMDNGRVVVGNVYQELERKIVVFSPSGAVELERAKVRRIDEHEGNVPADLAGPSTPLKSPAVVSGRVPERPKPTSGKDEKDPKKRDDTIARQLIFLYRDRAMARNNKDLAAVDLLNTRIQELEAERSAEPGKSETPTK